MLKALERGQALLYIAWHSLSNFFYLVAPMQGGYETKDYLAGLSQFLQVSPTTTDSLRYASQLPMKDFEDAMQVAAAVAGKANVMATRNIRAYAKSPIRAFTPKQVLQELANHSPPRVHTALRSPHHFIR